MRTIIGIILSIGIQSVLLCGSALGASPQWIGSGPLATGQGNRTIPFIAVTPDGKALLAGTNSGTVFSFFYLPPTVTTLAATNITSTSATLNGIINANDTTSNLSFQYGTTSDYTFGVAPVPPIQGGPDDNPVTRTLTGLNPCTTYHFRLIAANNGGLAAGDDQAFTTECLLSVATSGLGSGSVASDSGGIACSSAAPYGTCTAAYPVNTPVTLSVTTTGNSTFSGWAGGVCSGVASCHLAMNANFNETATFGAGPAKAKIASTGYASLNNAYSAAGANATIVAVNGTLAETLNMVHGKNIILKGGYDSQLSTPTPSPTVLTGKLTIQSGSLKVNKVKVKP